VRLNRTLEGVLLLPVGIVLTPIVLACATLGAVLSIPTLIARMPWRALVTRPHRFVLGLVILTVKFVGDWLTTVGYARVFFGRSLSSDSHPRDWQLPYRLRVAHRFALAVVRYLGVRKLEAAVQRRILSWCRANPPSNEQLHRPLPVIDASELDEKEFHRRFVSNPHPVVIRGFHGDSPAVRRWTPEYFRRYADDVAPVTKTGSEADEVLTSTLGEYLDYIEQNVELPPERRTVPRYLANFANLCNAHPELLDMLEIPRFEQLLSGARRASCVGAHLFIGLSGTATPFHCAMAPNWFVQVQGRKRWTFVHPDYTPLMYPVIGGDAYFSGSLLEYPEPPRERAAVDYPLWCYCPRHEIVLEPGDVLYNPPWYWHRIYNESSPTIGSATRWLILPVAQTNTLFAFCLGFHARFFAHALGLLCKRGGEPRLTDETTLTVEQRRSRYVLFERLRARLPSRRVTIG
jgi:hypothetical protein